MATKAASIAVALWPVVELLRVTRVVRLDLGIVMEMDGWSLCAAAALSVLLSARNVKLGSAGGSDSWPPGSESRPRPIPPTRPSPPEFYASIPPSKNLTPAVRQCLNAAHGEAARLGHGFIGTEHILLGLLQLAEGRVAKVLQGIHVDREAVRMEIERLVSGQAPEAATGPLPLTPRAHKALQLAVGEAKALTHSRIAVEHLFLGLLLEGGGVAARVLRTLGVRLDDARRILLAELGANPSGC